MGQKLLDRVNSVARLKHFSIRTEKAYRYYIKQFILFHNKRHPAEMSEEHIRTHLSHLATALHVAASTQNVALAALLFCNVACYETSDTDLISKHNSVGTATPAWLIDP